MTIFRYSGAFLENGSGIFARSDRGGADGKTGVLKQGANGVKRTGGGAVWRGPRK